MESRGSNKKAGPGKATGAVQEDFGDDEFKPVKDQTKAYLNKREPKEAPTTLGGIDRETTKMLIRENNKLQMGENIKTDLSDKNKKSYSIYEDMIIIKCFKNSQNEEKSIGSTLETARSQLVQRSQESVKERYRKWIKRFSNEDINKITKFCKNKSRTDLEGLMIKRKQIGDIFQLSEIVPIDNGNGNRATLISRQTSNQLGRVNSLVRAVNRRGWSMIRMTKRQSPETRHASGLTR